MSPIHRSTPIPRVVLAGLALLASGASDAQLADESANATVIELARRALQDSGVDAAHLSVTVFEPATWPDSSLGCPKRGLQYRQVTSSGYRVGFADGERAHEVHVAGAATVVCDAAGALGVRPQVAQLSMRNLDALIERAKDELAQATGASKEAIQVLGLAPARWPDRTLGCASQDGVPPQPTAAPDTSPGKVAGYRVVLGLAGRPYTFHSDGVQILACPPIEVR